MILCSIQGEIVTPGSIDYNIDRQIWNRAIQRYPSVLAYCESAYDVSCAVNCAYEMNIPIRIRSGGHNYEGYSIGDKVFVIDVSRINKIKIDEMLGTVTVGTGVQNSRLYEAVGRRGYPFPSGTCPTVGVSGICLGGGWGLSARRYGLVCDSLVEAQMVDYTGRILTANENTNRELFWALRGAGGGNFGVVVSLTFQLPPKTGNITYFELYYQNAEQATQIRFMDIFQRWIVTVNPDINVQAGIYNTESDGIYIFMRGICYGNPAKTKALLAPFYFTDKLEETVEYAPFLEVIRRVESSYPPSEKFKSTGRFVNRFYSKSELIKLTDIVNAPRPTGSVLTSLSVYGLGGRVKCIKPRETAFYFRDAKYIILIQSVWEDDRYAEDNRRWVIEHFPEIYNVTEGSYINFPLLQLPNYVENYFGGNAPELYRVKQLYDPCNVFTFPQSIPEA